MRWIMQPGGNEIEESIRFTCKERRRPATLVRPSLKYRAANIFREGRERQCAGIHCAPDAPGTLHVHCEPESGTL
jgi:hypothetical protein